MTEIPGRCLSCGAIDTFGGLISPVGSAELTLDNVTMARACRRCGGDVQLVDGTFDIKNEILSIVRAPGWTYDTLRDLRGELEWTLRHLAEDPDAAVERIEKISPEVGSLIRRTMAHELYGPTLQLIGALLAALSVLIGAAAFGYNVASDSSVQEKVEQEVERAISERPSTGNQDGVWTGEAEPGGSYDGGLDGRARGE